MDMDFNISVLVYRLKIVISEECFDLFSYAFSLPPPSILSKKLHQIGLFAFHEEKMVSMPILLF